MSFIKGVLGGSAKGKAEQEVGSKSARTDSSQAMRRIDDTKVDVAMIKKA